MRNGESIHLRRTYFANATVVGLDIGYRPQNYPEAAHYVGKTQEDPESLGRACKMAAPFDIIIDDAVHVEALAKAPFELLFREHFPI